MGLLDGFLGSRKSSGPTDEEIRKTYRAIGIHASCNCFEPLFDSGQPNSPRCYPELTFHWEEQDTACEGWRLMEELIAKAAADRVKVFAPGCDISPELWSQIITLPASIAKLTTVKKLYLYASHLVRIPPEIGDMTSLEQLDCYTSYRLHWLPYEVTHCQNLKRSCFSTRALHGNYKYRPPFPLLNLNTAKPPIATSACSVCRKPIDPSASNQVWISLRIATDVLPLLVNACSPECIAHLPQPTKDYVDHPHKGGIELVQPSTFYDRYK